MNEKFKFLRFDVWQLKQLHTFAENGAEVIEEVFGFENFTCIRDLLIEASNEAVEELIIEQVIE